MGAFCTAVALAPLCFALAQCVLHWRCGLASAFCTVAPLVPAALVPPAALRGPCGACACGAMALRGLLRRLHKSVDSGPPRLMFLCGAPYIFIKTDRRLHLKKSTHLVCCALLLPAALESATLLLPCGAFSLRRFVPAALLSATLLFFACGALACGAFVCDACYPAGLLSATPFVPAAL